MASWDPSQKAGRFVRGVCFCAAEIATSGCRKSTFLPFHGCSAPFSCNLSPMLLVQSQSINLCKSRRVNTALLVSKQFPHNGNCFNRSARSNLGLRVVRHCGGAPPDRGPCHAEHVFYVANQPLEICKGNWTAPTSSASNFIMFIFQIWFTRGNLKVEKLWEGSGIKLLFQQIFT